MRGDIELFGENLPVAAGLIEHEDEIAVLKDVLHLAGGEQVFDILRDAGGNASPLAEALPDFHRVGRRLLLAQQKVHFVNVVAGGFVGFPVDGHSIPHGVLHDEHPDLLELLAQLLDVEADNAVFDVDVGAVVEHVERAGNVDFQSRGDVLRLLFLLPPQLVIQVLQNRHILRHRVAEIIPVHHAHTAVDDGLFHRHEAVLAAHDQLAEGEDEVGFQAQRVFIVAVIEIQVHGIDVVRACGGNFNDLPVQTLHQRSVLGFGVADDNVVVSNEEHVGDLPLRRKALAAAGGTKDEAVGVLETLAIYHDEVVRQRVQPAVQGFLAVLKQLLRGKGNENGDAGGGQTPLYLDLVQPQREAAHQPLLLPEIKAGKLAVVLLSDGGRLKYVVVKLLAAACRIDHDEGQQKHTLVAALQVLQQLLRLRAVGGKVRGDDVHVVSGADGLFLLLDGHFLQIRDLALDGLDGLDLIHGLDVHTDDEGAFHVEEVRQHPVVQLRR